MSERKILNKYYPLDFDPSQVKRTRGPKSAGLKVQHREYIYKGRKFNAREETPVDEKYLNIQIYRFYIQRTRCSAEITFKTHPKNMDYIRERGAWWNFEVWRPADQVEETVDERLDRREKEEADQLEDRDAMQELEAKARDLKTEEKIADALDAIRTRNAERNRTEEGHIEDIAVANEDNAQEQDERDADIAREVFQKERLYEDVVDVKEELEKVWTVTKKSKKTNREALLPGIIRKV